MNKGPILLMTGYQTPAAIRRGGVKGIETSRTARSEAPLCSPSMLMTRQYSWAYRSPARRLYYNIATTGMTVAVAAFIASVYVAGLAADATGAGGLLTAYASLADHFELLGYIVVAIFAASWLLAAAIWRYRGLAEKYGDRQCAAHEAPQRP